MVPEVRERPVFSPHVAGCREGHVLGTLLAQWFMRLEWSSGFIGGPTTFFLNYSLLFMLLQLSQFASLPLSYSMNVYILALKGWVSNQISQPRSPGRQHNSSKSIY